MVFVTVMKGFILFILFSMSLFCAVWDYCVVGEEFNIIYFRCLKDFEYKFEDLMKIWKPLK